LTSGDHVLLIDDLITTGLSLRKTAKAIEAEGGVIRDAVVLLDREEGGKEKLQREGIKLHAFLKISEIADRLYEIGAIDEDQMKTILGQIKKRA
nr:orotate phosphoribosyltransferase [Candidatus Korarchaeota archaeon]NIU84661.1 orotate phosphoribosyltransferase [Candidatus Thorarchaeota archaeon]